MDYTLAGLREWLLNENEKGREDRIVRLKFLIEEFGQVEGIQFFHGMLAKDFFEEARWCYVNGQFIGAVLLCQCFLELTLRSLLSAGGLRAYGVTDKWLEDAGFYELIEKAHEYGLISDESAADFHWVRTTRVQYIHPKPPFSEKHFGQRVASERIHPVAIFAKDARRAMKIMLEFNQYTRERA